MIVNKELNSASLKSVQIVSASLAATVSRSPPLIMRFASSDGASAITSRRKLLVALVSGRNLSVARAVTEYRRNSRPYFWPADKLVNL